MLSTLSFALEDLVELVVYLAIVGGVVWLLLWLISYVGLPAPFNKVARVVVMVAAVLILISVLLSFVGHPIIVMRH